MKKDKSNNFKNREGIVYSTNPDFSYQTNDIPEQETIEPDKQKLKILKDSKGRAGKTVTIVRGYVGKTDDLEQLCKVLKNKCGVGGSVKEGEILIQGDLVEKVKKVLTDLGYKST